MAGSLQLCGDQFVDDLRTCARQDGDIFSFLMFPILRTIADTDPAQRDSVRYDLAVAGSSPLLLLAF